MNHDSRQPPFEHEPLHYTPNRTLNLEATIPKQILQPPSQFRKRNEPTTRTANLQSRHPETPEKKKTLKYEAWISFLQAPHKLRINPTVALYKPSMCLAT